MNFDRFCGLLSASVICLTLAIVSWSGIVGPIWRASYSATPDQWLGFAGSLIGAVATLLAAGVALFAAYKTLKPMRDQLTQLVRQSDHSLYDDVRKRAAELNVERHAVERIHATSAVVEIALKVSRSNPDGKAVSRIEKVIDQFQAELDSIRDMRATVWGSLEVQSDRNAFVDLCFGMSDDLGALFFEMKTEKKMSPDSLAKHVRAWTQSRERLVELGNKLHGHVESELERVGRVVSELEDRLFIK